MGGGCPRPFLGGAILRLSPPPPTLPSIEFRVAGILSLRKQATSSGSLSLFGRGVGHSPAFRGTARKNFGPPVARSRQAMLSAPMRGHALDRGGKPGNAGRRISGGAGKSGRPLTVGPRGGQKDRTRMAAWQVFGRCCGNSRWEGLGAELYRLRGGRGTVPICSALLRKSWGSPQRDPGDWLGAIAGRAPARWTLPRRACPPSGVVGPACAIGGGEPRGTVPGVRGSGDWLGRTGSGGEGGQSRFAPRCFANLGAAPDAIPGTGWSDRWTVPARWTLPRRACPPSGVVGPGAPSAAANPGGESPACVAQGTGLGVQAPGGRGTVPICSALLRKSWGGAQFLGQAPAGRPRARRP